MEPLNWRSEGGHLMIGKANVASVAKQLGTPLYLYDANIILDRTKRVQRAFPNFGLFYSVKANPHPAIVKILAGLGLGAGVASLDEIKLAMELGFPLEDIAFGGPGKRYNELSECVRSNIGMVNVESEIELLRLEELGKALQKEVPVSIRINTMHRPRSAREFMAGGPSQFGIDEEKVIQKLRKLQCHYVKYQGIHTFVASQVLDYSSLIKHFARVAKISKDIAGALDFELKVINFGGGFGVPYSQDETHLDLNHLGEQIDSVLSEAFLGNVNKPKFCIELGRYLVAECGIFLTEILDVKGSRGHKFVITDSGISGLSRPAMQWAQHHPCSIVSKVGEQETGTYDIVGPSCMPSDVLCENVGLPDPKPGDVLAVRNAGAYGWTMSMLLWSSQVTPIEALFHEGQLHVIRKRLNTKELLTCERVSIEPASNERESRAKVISEN